MKANNLIISAMAFLISSSALADAAPPPVDQNKSGAFAGASLSFGQSRAVGKSNPGVGYFLAPELGYISADQEWNRLEASFEFGFGHTSFEDKSGDEAINVNLPINLFALAKFGYGYKVGSNAFGVIRIGAGPAMAKYPKKATKNQESAESLSGFMGLLGYDLVIPTQSALEFVTGAEVRFISFTGDSIDSLQLNIPSLKFGVRAKL